MTKKKVASEPVVSLTTDAQEDPNEGVVFDYGPVRCICPHCERTIVTFTDHEASWVTYALGALVWLSMRWMAIWVLPVLWPAFKDVVHHCPRCLNVIATRSRISLPTFKTEVMTLKIGSCAVVLARKYVIIFLAFITVILGTYTFRATVPDSKLQVPRGRVSNFTWQEFLVDCYPAILQPKRTKHLGRQSPKVDYKIFERKYLRRTFKWEGEVLRIREGGEILFWRTKSVLFVKMFPTRLSFHDDPDISLLFGEERNKDVANFMPGDWIEFEGTMNAVGYRGEPQVMTLWGAKAAERPENLTVTLSSLPMMYSVGPNRLVKPGKDHVPSKAERDAKALNASSEFNFSSLVPRSGSVAHDPMINI
eukprot:gnl/MRDRNA2_/MRDRNA2_30256_c0_seq1.p1 gnl/MRDRNA2_/MRDRNA2_30256_c0~~gnl/MRDRNA2_/MRDRNA2_30256_c0_seq1.p1  ORF type:complete len:364 (-),score=44.50 gnl/MRDRNA2_/MRDRNA2_30256_c0_seq1:202-1293(-)